MHRKNTSAFYLSRKLHGAPKCPLDTRTSPGAGPYTVVDACEFFEILLKRCDAETLSPEMIEWMANHEDKCDQHTTDEPEGIVIADPD